MICMSCLACRKSVTIPDTCPRPKSILSSKISPSCLRIKARLSFATSSENISLTSVVASIALMLYQSVRGDNDIGFFSPFQDLPSREPAKEEDHKVEYGFVSEVDHLSLFLT